MFFGNWRLQLIGLIMIVRIRSCQKSPQNISVQNQEVEIYQEKDNFMKMWKNKMKFLSWNKFLVPYYFGQTQ